MTLVCFPEGTKVHTQWGLANIERLQEGVPVLTYNEQTGEKEYKPVLKTSRRMTQRMCILEFAGGRMLEVTPEHRFFCGGEWIPVEDLEIGSVLQTKNNEYLVIENKTIIPKFVEVFNIEVQDNENYYVTEDGVLVHNGYGRKELPVLDDTGKVHGELPAIEDLKQYDADELEIFRDQLKESVQERIRKTSEVGDNFSLMQNKQHGERQAAEQALIHAIDKILGK